MHASDTHIAQGLRNGNPDSYEALYRKYYVQLCTFCAKYIKDDSIAEEIVQSLIVRIWEKHQELNIPDELKLYLFKSAYNNCISHLRRSTKITREDYEIVEKTEPTAISQSIEAAELSVKIEASKQNMPEQTLKIFELSRDAALSYPEIAHELSISIKTVEYHISKALKFFRAELRDFFIVFVLFALGCLSFCALNIYSII